MDLAQNLIEEIYSATFSLYNKKNESVEMAEWVCCVVSSAMNILLGFVSV